LLWLFGLNVAFNPFKKKLKKFLMMRLLLSLIQGLLLLAMAALAIFVMLGSVYIAVVLMFFFVTAPIRVGLDLFEVKNSFEISAFLSFTFTSIIFSCKGNAIINRITIFWRGRNKEKIQGELNFINTYLGQN